MAIPSLPASYDVSWSHHRLVQPRIRRARPSPGNPPAEWPQLSPSDRKDGSQTHLSVSQWLRGWPSAASFHYLCFLGRPMGPARGNEQEESQASVGSLGTWAPL